MHVVIEPFNCSAFEIQTAIVEQLQRFYSLRRIFGSYCRGRSWRLKYRAGGHYLIQRWVRENSEYLERLRNNFYKTQMKEKDGFF
ncbi:MAG: hypothetical protein HQK78_19660 [Desulfobacterales bacterium]|nr:hypothetical protein [Desulfobacterales bacterium]